MRPTSCTLSRSRSQRPDFLRRPPRTNGLARSWTAQTIGRSNPQPRVVVSLGATPIWAPSRPQDRCRSADSMWAIGSVDLGYPSRTSRGGLRPSETAVGGPYPRGLIPRASVGRRRPTGRWPEIEGPGRGAGVVAAYLSALTCRFQGFAARRVDRGKPGDATAYASESLRPITTSAWATAS